MTSFGQYAWRTGTHSHWTGGKTPNDKVRMHTRYFFKRLGRNISAISMFLLHLGKFSFKLLTHKVLLSSIFQIRSTLKIDGVIALHEIRTQSDTIGSSNVNSTNIFMICYPPSRILTELSAYITPTLV